MHLLIKYAMSMVGTPYIWGGEGPPHIGGYDCSGFIQEVLKSAGEDPKLDQTAQALYDYFQHRGDWNKITKGSLVFYGKDPKHVTHVAMMIDQYRIIEAGGGGPKTKTREDAIKQKAFIRVRPFHERKDLIGIVRPKYKKIGLL